MQDPVGSLHDSTWVIEIYRTSSYFLARILLARHDNNLNLIQKTMASAEYIANVMAGLEQVGAAIKAREQASSDRTSSCGLRAVARAHPPVYYTKPCYA